MYKFPLVPDVNKIIAGVKTNQRHGRDITKENEGIDIKQLGKQSKTYFEKIKHVEAYIKN